MNENHQAEKCPEIRERLICGIVQWHGQDDSPGLSLSKGKKLS